MQAALDARLHGTRQKSRIEALLANIQPGLEGLDLAQPPDTLIQAAVEANVRWTVRQIKESPEGRARLAEGTMQIAGAVYEIAAGAVRFLREQA